MTPKVRKAAFFALLLALCGAVQAQEAVKALVGQKSREVQILCGPEQEKSLFFYGQNCYSSLALAPDAQKALADAAQKYLLQYDEKRLKKPKGADKKRRLAKVPARLEWGPRKDALQRSAKTEISLGYVFYGKSPYFYAEIPKEKSQEAGQSPAYGESEPQSLLFNRSQLKALLALLAGL